MQNLAPKSQFHVFNNLIELATLVENKKVHTLMLDGHPLSVLLKTVLFGLIVSNILCPMAQESAYF